MIDTAKLYFHLTNEVRQTLEDRDFSSPTVAMYPDRMYIKHPFGHASLIVRLDQTKSMLWTETSLPKLLQGHNVVGSNNVHQLSLSTIAFIYQQIGLHLSPTERRRILDHGIRLGRLDTTASFLLKSNRMTGSVLKSIWHQLHASGVRWSAYGNNVFESVYNQIHSTRVSDKFYDKYAEIRRSITKSIPSGVPGRTQIIRFARHALRFETTWRAKELLSLDLEYSDDWTPKIVRELIAERMRRFRFSGVIRPRLREQELVGLNDTSRMFYELWADGAELRRYRRCRTLKRTREMLLTKYSVDLVHPAQTGCDESLAELLDPNRAYYSAPRSLIRRGAVFWPD